MVGYLQCSPVFLSASTLFASSLPVATSPPQALDAALDPGRSVIALSITDRERILRVLNDCPDGLAELRGVLQREHEWRARARLV
jgi:hypothetical protein